MNETLTLELSDGEKKPKHAAVAISASNVSSRLRSPTFVKYCFLFINCHSREIKERLKTKVYGMTVMQFLFCMKCDDKMPDLKKKQKKTMK